MILTKYNPQEELNKSLQVLAKACAGSPTHKVTPSINKTEVELRSDKTVHFRKSAICQKEKPRGRIGTSNTKSRVMPKQRAAIPPQLGCRSVLVNN